MVYSDLCFSVRFVVGVSYLGNEVVYSNSVTSIGYKAGVSYIGNRIVYSGLSSSLLMICDT